jgi:hypothetical protein
VKTAKNRASILGPFFGDIRKRLLPTGHELDKFTDYSLFNPDGAVTPWWFSVEPLEARDPGLEETLDRAQRLGVLPSELMQARGAVTRQWNSMKGFLRVRLLVPVFGFAGRCASQRYDESPAFANVAFIGGAWQLYIPNLTQKEVV